jgi:hypothetical protein
MPKEPDTSTELLTTSAIFVGLYLVVAVVKGIGIATSGANSSALGFFLGFVVASAILVAIGVAMTYTNRGRPGAAVGVVVSSVMGILLCLVG